MLVLAAKFLLVRESVCINVCRSEKGLLRGLWARFAVRIFVLSDLSQMIIIFADGLSLASRAHHRQLGLLSWELLWLGSCGDLTAFWSNFPGLRRGRIGLWLLVRGLLSLDIGGARFWQ